MPVANKLSLLDAVKLISSDFKDSERRFAGYLFNHLKCRIDERRKAALRGNSSSAVGGKIKLAIAVIRTVVSTFVGFGVAIPVSAIATPAIGMLAGVVASLGTEVLGRGVNKGLKITPKRRIERNAKIYNEYFPEENSGLIKLFSQLVSFSMLGNFQAIFLSQIEPTPTQFMSKKMDKAIDKVARARKVSRQGVKDEIEALASKEFTVIWTIFKEFTRDREAYSSFNEMPEYKKITDLFMKYCDLGDAQDKSSIVSDFEVHTLWINVFARYLEGKEPEVREEILIRLNNAFSANAYNSMLNAARHQSTMDVGQSTVSLTSQHSSSSGIGSGDSLASQAGIIYAPRFFAPQAVAEERLAANNPEPEQHLGPGIRL
ncbi:hypothetical protein RVIR1_06740 [Candidatus Rickettsiella viridis]|uniref:Uncharacterized protein n=1 Tax=Candidatus Rickettsiella viridis TaxID=676208 RepID=A0A2Z5UVW3_9COXI|nr:hypothetical protein [Candidatus Rickettsiella viridis]BBB15171.1 hypothetical protein RVIR1_06740 [Candidatus Rickettsiella viridis]